MSSPEFAVVDASVAVKWYVPERDHEDARVLRDEYLDGKYDLMAPEMFPFEVVNALRYSGHFETDQLEEAVESLSNYGVDLVPFHRGGPTVEVATELDVPIYDASYLALAFSQDCRMFTADEKLIAAARATKYADHIANVTTLDAG